MIYVNDRECEYNLILMTDTRSVARKETLDVHQKNWECHIYCQINVQKNKKK